MRLAILCALACMILAASNAGAAPASSLEVAPTTLELKPAEPGLLYVANHSGVPITVQIDIYDWTQSQNADHLALSDTAFVSPPLTTIAAGERQVIRVLAQPKQSKSEAAYRVRVSQLPDPPVKPSGVQVLLQFSIPVFVRGADEGANVAWTATASGSSLRLTAQNTGGRTLKLGGLAISSPGVAAFEAAPGRVSYLLPGTSHDWSIDALASAARIHVAAIDERDGKPLTADLTITR